MRALTKWNSYSNNNKKLIPKLRQLLLFPLFFLNKNKNVISDDDLPVGLPSSASANLQNLASEFKTVKEKGDLMELAATHASLLLENVLFPSETKDPFTTLNTTQSWSANNKQGDATMQVLRACLVELSLDYCSRLSTRVTNSYVDEILADPDAKVNMTEVQDGLKKRFEEREPYCAMFDDCFEEDFVFNGGGLFGSIVRRGEAASFNSTARLVSSSMVTIFAILLFPVSSRSFLLFTLLFSTVPS